jgi:hypothetical protein
MRGRYPKGIDLATGCKSTTLEPVELPTIPPSEDNEVAADLYEKFDRSDPDNPWNRFLVYKMNEKFSYQRHLGFGQKKYPAAQVLAARKKENAIKKVQKLKTEILSGSLPPVISAGKL